MKIGNKIFVLFDILNQVIFCCMNDEGRKHDIRFRSYWIHTTHIHPHNTHTHTDTYNTHTHTTHTHTTHTPIQHPHNTHTHTTHTHTTRTHTHTSIQHTHSYNTHPHTHTTTHIQHTHSNTQRSNHFTYRPNVQDLTTNLYLDMSVILSIRGLQTDKILTVHRVLGNTQITLDISLASCLYIASQAEPILSVRRPSQAEPISSATRPSQARSTSRLSIRQHVG